MSSIALKCLLVCWIFHQAWREWRRRSRQVVKTHYVLAQTSRRALSAGVTGTLTGRLTKVRNSTCVSEMLALYTAVGSV